MISVLIVLFIAFILLKKIDALQQRVTVLEKQSDTVFTTQNSGTETSAHQTHDTELQNNTVEDIFAGANAVKKKEYVSLMQSWFLHEWPMKVGALLILSAIGWMATYAFIHDIIGPVGRTALAFLFGISFYIFGAYRVSRVYVQGAVALFMGLITLAIALFAGVYYEFFSAALMIFPLLVAIVFVTYTAYIYSHRSLAAASIFFAFLVPVVFMEHLFATTILLYIVILTLGVSAIIMRSLWRDVLILLIFGVIAQSIMIYTLYGFDEIFGASLMMATLVLLLYGTHLVILLRTHKLRSSDVIIGGSIGFLAWISTMILVSRDFQTMTLALTAIVFALGVFALLQRSRAQVATFIYGGVSLGIVCSAIASAFPDNIVALWFLVTTAITLYLVGLIVALWRTDLPSAEQLLYKLSFIAFVIPFFGTIMQVIAGLFDNTTYVVFEEPTFMPDGTVIPPIALQNAIVHVDMEMIAVSAIVAIGAFIIAGTVLQKVFGGQLRWTLVHDAFHKMVVRVFGTIGAAYASAALWMGLQAFLPYGAAVTIALVIYAAIGVGFYIHGGQDNYKPYRVIGSAFLILVATHLFLYDFWTLPISAKIAVFALTGMLFISTAFFARRTDHS